MPDRETPPFGPPGHPTSAKRGRGKQPFYIRMRDGRPFAFAGLWERWEPPDGAAVETCAILTTGANAILAPIHDRMPVIVPPGEYGRWLDPAIRDPGSLTSLLAPFPAEGMVAFPVGTRVNAPSNDDPGCVEPDLREGR